MFIYDIWILICIYKNADTKKTIVNRKFQPYVRYKKVFGKYSIKPGQDIDYIHDLQLCRIDGSCY